MTYEETFGDKPNNFNQYVLGANVHLSRMKGANLEYRRGQAFVNYFRYHFPSIEIPSDIDPFYESDRIEEFHAFVYAQLENSSIYR